MDLFTSVRKAGALDRLAELEEQDAQLFAARAQALVDVEDVCRAQPDSDHALEFVALDIATACDIAQITATARLTKAKHLIHDLPLTFEHLRRGQLRVGQAVALMEETKDLPATTCQAVEARALPKVLGMTSGDTRRTVKRIIVTVDAEASEARRQTKIRERRIWNSPRPDGRAMIGAELSAEDAGRFHRGLTVLARSLYGPQDPRTLDQQCADLFAQLPDFAIAHLADPEPSTCSATCTGSGPGLRAFLGLAGPGSALTRRQARKVQAVVLIPCETALDLAEHGAELIDYGPITSFHARDLLAAAELRKACTDLRTGRLIALEDAIVRPSSATWVPSLLELELLAMVDRRTPVETRSEPGHDPSPGLTDFVQLRDTRCVGPGCSMPARSCDLEHLQPHPDGETTADNLGPASRRCHNAKTYGGWTLQPHPDGSVTWTSPMGRTFTRPSRTEPADLTDLRPPPRRTPTAETDKGASNDGDEGDEQATDTSAS